MIRDAASSSTCSGASAGGSGSPSDGSPQIQPARPRSGPHSAATGSPVPGSLASTDSASFMPSVFTQSYFYVKSFDLKVSLPWANGAPGASHVARASPDHILPAIEGRPIPSATFLSAQTNRHNVTS